MMMMVLCRQRVQAVHDHGGRRVGETSLVGPAYHGIHRTRNARTNYFIIVTARCGYEWVEQDAGSVEPEYAPGTYKNTGAPSRISALIALPTRRNATLKLVASGACLYFYEWSICSIFGSRSQGLRPISARG